MAFAMIVTIIGFLLLLDKMGLVSGEVWEFFWPLVIISIGLSMMFNRMDRDACWCGSSHAHQQKKTTTKSSKGKKRS